MSMRNAMMKEHKMATRMTKEKSVVPTVSLHQRILDALESNILTGKWPPGHRVPSEQALTEEYSCSRMTVSKVLNQLANAGLILRRRKTGSVVLPQRMHSAILEIYDVKDEVSALNQVYRYEILNRKIRSSNARDAENLNLQSKHRLLQIDCLHFADDNPFCLEERIVNLTAVPDVVEEDFSDLSPGRWLLNHIPWSAAEHRIFAEGAEPFAAATLHIEPGTPCLVVERRTWRTDQSITYAKLTYPGKTRTLTAIFTPSST